MKRISIANVPCFTNAKETLSCSYLAQLAVKYQLGTRVLTEGLINRVSRIALIQCFHV